MHYDTMVHHNLCSLSVIFAQNVYFALTREIRLKIFKLKDWDFVLYWLTKTWLGEQVFCGNQAKISDLKFVEIRRMIIKTMKNRASKSAWHYNVVL